LSSSGKATANSAGALDIPQILGIDADLRVKPFFAEGNMSSLREFISTAFHNELGTNANDPDLIAASSGARIVTPAGMVLDGTKDKIQPPPTPNPGTGNEIDTALVNHMEFYLLNYFKPGHDKQTETTDGGRVVFERIGCSSCHVANLMINRDRRVADLARRPTPPSLPAWERNQLAALTRPNPRQANSQTQCRPRSKLRHYGICS
jgi:hypothetical protein